MAQAKNTKIPKKPAVNSSKLKKQIVPEGKFAVLLHHRWFAGVYRIAAILILAGTTLYWSLLTARLQTGNADQLADPYLFESTKTFHGALFPAAHTFLLKWPLFWFIKLAGFSVGSYSFFTVLLCLVTLGTLAYLLWRLERRRIVFGTLCLALASVLLLVPAAPYAGGILPVNMAMLTTRNFEYVLYILSLVYILRHPDIRSKRFWIGVTLLALLAVSDRLFITLAVGGALMALVSYAFAGRWKPVNLSVNWLLMGGAGTILALFITLFLGATHIVHIAGGGVSPYSSTGGISDLALGVFYGIAALFTNYGANPAFDATRVRDVPSHVFHGLFSLAGPSYLINIAICLGAIVATSILLYRSFQGRRQAAFQRSQALRLGALLTWTSIAGIAAFIASSHYYAVDARYLSISLFSGFFALGLYLRTKTFSRHTLVIVGLVLLGSVLLGMLGFTGNYYKDRDRLSDINARNNSIAQALKQHHVDALVGDYWRVLPTKLASGSVTQVMPLSSCTGPRASLTSQNWNLDLTKHSFAYVLSLDRSLTDFPSCTLQQIVSAFGKPNASLLIKGSFAAPQEQLLFFDHGAHPDNTMSQTALSINPTLLNDLPHTNCQGPTTMTVIAHQDDDLLFMNPDLQHEISAGHCVRSIYVTAGDAGHGNFYWLSREQGSEAAYSNMLGIQDIWIQRVVQLPGGQFATVVNPKGNDRISLIFMHLPDGNFNGEGFGVSHYGSLAKLASGWIHAMRTVDGQSTYTKEQLTTALSSLMGTYNPSQIWTLANVNLGGEYPDHSDHVAVGGFADAAHLEYQKQQFENNVDIPVHYYIGYPIHARPPNISGADLTHKESTFLAYAKFDGSVCRTQEECSESSTYGSYLTRQYQLDQATDTQ